MSKAALSALAAEALDERVPGLLAGADGRQGDPDILDRKGVALQVRSRPITCRPKADDGRPEKRALGPSAESPRARLLVRNERPRKKKKPPPDNRRGLLI